MVNGVVLQPGQWSQLVGILGPQPAQHRSAADEWAKWGPCLNKNNNGVRKSTCLTSSYIGTLFNIKIIGISIEDERRLPKYILLFELCVLLFLFCCFLRCFLGSCFGFSSASSVCFRFLSGW